MIIHFTNEEFILLGLQLAGFSVTRIGSTGAATNNERFKSFFGISATTCSILFEDFQTTDVDDAKIKNPVPKKLLTALIYLKEYRTKYSLAAFADVTEKVALQWAHEYVGKIQALKDTKIKWLFDNPAQYPELFIISVDGVHCRIGEPRTQPSAGWFSKKYNKAGLAYELGIAIFHNQLCWINGPFPAGHNDMKMFKNDNGLMEKIPAGRKAIGDEGYVGAPDHVATRNPFDSDAVKRFKKRVKARHETFNGRLKDFGILEQRFRGQGASRVEKHKAVFEACCVLVQYQMDNGHPLFDV